MTDLNVDLFAGPGGWDLAMGQLGLRVVGLEWDAAACATRAAAGHPTIRCDVAAYPTEPFKGRVSGLVDSAPCQPWSKSGHGLGLKDQPLVHEAVHDLSQGRDTRAKLLAACRDPRSLLAAEPMRWLYDLRPEWTAMEEVPEVLPLFRHIAEILRSWGYSVWCGVLNTANYGLGQARRRAILVASCLRQVGPPPPTHSEHAGTGLFGADLPPWRTMADVLGWGWRDRPAPTVTGGGTETGGAEPFSSTSRRAMREAMNDPTHWAWKKPAPTVGGTVGHVGGKQAGGHLNLEPDEGAALQSFPTGYPFQGNKGQRSLQIGNAIPPLLALHVLAAATGLPIPAPIAEVAA